MRDIVYSTTKVQLTAQLTIMIHLAHLFNISSILPPASAVKLLHAIFVLCNINYCYIIVIMVMFTILGTDSEQEVWNIDVTLRMAC